MFFSSPLRPHFDAALRDVHAQGRKFRLAAAQRLSDTVEERKPEAIAGLNELAQDDYPDVREAALLSLAELADESSLFRIQQSLRDPDPWVAGAAIYAAARVGGDATTNEIVKLAHDPREQVRIAAIRSLSFLEPADEEVFKEIAGLSDDPDAGVRLAALDALRTAKTGSFEAIWRKHLQDPDHYVAFAAARALAERALSEAAPTLLRVLEKSDGIDPCEAAVLLAQLEYSAASDALQRQAKRWFVSPFLRAACGAALIKLGAVEVGLKAWKRALKRRDVRGYAIELAGRMSLEPTFESLIDLSTKRSIVDQDVLIDALKAFGIERPEVKQAIERVEASRATFL